MSIVAFIPVRCGSKGIPLKNIKSFCGRPLVYWVLKAAQGTNAIDEIIVSTDCAEIEKTVNNLNIPKVKIHKRSIENANDTSSTESVMLEYIKDSDISPQDDMILIQATSPFTTSEHLKQGINQYINEDCDSILSVVANGHFLWNDKGESINYDFNNRPRRQDFAPQYSENGAFYINKVSNIQAFKNRLSGKVSLSIMPKHTSIELDDMEDWTIGENIMNHILKGNT